MRTIVLFGVWLVVVVFLKFLVFAHIWSTDRRA